MQAPRATLEPVRRHGCGVFGEDGCIIEVALAKSDTLSVFEVNCGDQQHCLL